MALSNTDLLWLHIIPLVPSLIITVFVLYRFLKNRALWTSLHNHPIILMLFFGLILELTDAVWFIHFFRTDTALSSTREFCLVWAFIDSSLFVSVSLQMAWASIERHILIFHPYWFATKTKRIFLHYLPLFILSVWPLLFYCIILLVLPCDVPFDYNRRLCGHYDCVNRISWVAMFDNIAHYMVPVLIIVSFSLALLIRVLYHKCRIHQRIEWRNYRKMALQLLSISLIYTLLDGPWMILNAAYLSGLSLDIGANFYNNILALSLWVILFTPFASVTSLPDLKVTCRNVITFWRRKRVVRPKTITLKSQDPGHKTAMSQTAH